MLMQAILAGGKMNAVQYLRVEERKKGKKKEEARLGKREGAYVIEHNK